MESPIFSALPARISTRWQMDWHVRTFATHTQNRDEPGCLRLSAFLIPQSATESLGRSLNIFKFCRCLFTLISRRSSATTAPPRPRSSNALLPAGFRPFAVTRSAWLVATPMSLIDRRPGAGGRLCLAEAAQFVASFDMPGLALLLVCVFGFVPWHIHSK